VKPSQQEDVKQVLEKSMNILLFLVSQIILEVEELGLELEEQRQNKWKVLNGFKKKASIIL